jgi:hypothetical protein
VRSFLCAALFAAAVTACSSGGTPTSLTPSGMPAGAFPAAPVTTTMLHRNASSGAEAPVYIGTGSSRFDVFTDKDVTSSFPTEGTPIKPGFRLALTQIGQDGNLYISADAPTPQEIIEYGPWGHNVVRTITGFAGAIQSFDADKFGTLYVSEMVSGDQHIKVFVYPPGATTPTRFIYVAPSSAFAVVRVSPAGDLYAAYDDMNASTESVKVFARDTSAAAYSFSFRASLPSFAFDSSSNLYVTTMDSNDQNRGVLVYPPGSATASYEITNGTSTETSLAIDASTKTLYVLGNNHSISVYAAGATSPSYTIPSLSNGFPINMAVDPWNNLYVYYGDTSAAPYTAIYPAGSTTSSTQLGLYGSWGVLIGPVSQ